MHIRKHFYFSLVFALATLPAGLSAQEPATAPAKPTEHLLGTVTATDPSAHTITVEADGSGNEQVVELGSTKTLIKVPPGAKDLKTFSRITAAELAIGDRVDVRGSKAQDDPSKIAARSVVLMSAQELQVAHRAQAAEWQNATTGVVGSVDAAGEKITINQRTPAGPKVLVVIVSPQTEFTRYSPASPATPAASTINEVQPGDQVRVLGERSADGAGIAATRLYSGAFRTLNGTISSVDGDGKQLIIKDLATKKTMVVTLGDSSSIQTIPPEVAARIARRLNPGTRTATPAGGSTAAPPPTPASGSGMGAARGGDISQLIERLPTIQLADLKPGAAVVVSGVLAGTDGSHLVATHVISGVEPILQSAPAGQRGGQALGGDWGLGEMTTPQ